MSVQYRNQTTGILERVAGFNDTDSILSPSSKNPISNKAVYNALLQKIDKTVTDLINYYDKSQVYTKSEVRTLIGSINTLTIEVVSELPTQDISTTTIYFVGPATGTNTYDEYVYVNNAWVKIGDTDIDLTDYVTSSQLTTILQDYYTKNAIDALLNSYYTKTNVDNLLDDKQDTLTFDNTPTAGSNNPVKSSGIKTALDTKQNTLTFDNTPTENSNNVVKSGGIYSAVDDVYKVIGENGAKNLLPNNTTSKTINGITYTVNDDGSVTANGTATANAEFIFIKDTDDVTEFKNLIRDKTVTLSGCPSGGSGTTYTLRKWGQSTSGTYYDTGNGVTFTADAESLDNNSWNFQIRVYNGVTVSNLTFYPMLRLASDTDDTYQPYAKTNQQLTGDKAEQAEVNDIVNVYGAKNLLHTTSLNYLRQTNTASDGVWSGNEYTRRGITFTVNNDGSITANGTATADTYFALLKVGELETRDYKLSGCPSDGATDTYCIYTRNAAHNYVYDTGDGVIANMPYSESTINIKIANGQTVSDLTFYPMIRLASITDDTYEPYAKTNQQLTEDKAEKSQVSNPNLLDNPWFTVNQRGQSSYNASQSPRTVDRWVLYYGQLVINSDGSVTISVESGNQLQFQNRVDPLLSKMLHGKVVTLSAIVNNVLHSFSFTWNHNDNTIQRYTINDVWKLDFRNIPTDGDSGHFIRFINADTTSDANITITAVKLELGSVSTLANDTAPNYQQELAKCQRYFVRFKSNATYSVYSGMGYVVSATEVRTPMNLPVSMRQSPTVTTSGSFRIFNATDYSTMSQSITSVSGMGFLGSKLMLKCVGTGFISGKMAMLAADNDADTYIDFSADL